MFAKNVLVAAAALVATVAAQAQNVNVYGNLDVAVGSFETDLTHRITKVESSVLTGSFIGFKGQEDLGGGLKLNFKLESSVGVDTGKAGASTFWDRTSELGLTGAYGSVTGGNSVALSTRAQDAQGPFSVFGMLNGNKNVLALHGAGFGSIQANALTFSSQTYSGFSGALQYGARETNGTRDTYALQGNYATGPLAAGVTLTDKDGASLWQLGGSYDFGVAKAFAQIGEADVAANDDVQYFQLGVAAPVAANCKVLASWTHGKSNGLTTDELSFGYDHTLSKRTGAYVGVDYLRAKTTSSDSGISLAVGLRHAF